MGVNDELAKIVAALPHAHYCCLCDLEYRCKSRCWGQKTFMCSSCEAYHYGDMESYRVNQEDSDDSELDR